jgi:DNA-binding transcriptional MerR regulator
MASIPLPVPDDEPRHRSGAVARMVRMPVATLRVWERRYQLSSPALTPSGQRLYSAADVRRIALLKQLTEHGHAIGSLAGLDMAQLQEVAATHAHAVTGTLSAAPSPALTRWRVAVIGESLARRLLRPSVRRRLAGALEVLGPFKDAVEAAEGIGHDSVDLLLVHAPTLHPAWLSELQQAAPALKTVRTAAVYRFASESVCERLALAGVALLREPLADAALGQWLEGLAGGVPRAPLPPLSVAEPAPPRRWDDAALADIAGLSSTIACECPRHVAEILMQLTHFEAYSAECRNRSPADAELHAYLASVAALARAKFEEALERVAVHEGLLMPTR